MAAATDRFDVASPTADAKANHPVADRRHNAAIALATARANVALASRIDRRLDALRTIFRARRQALNSSRPVNSRRDLQQTEPASRQAAGLFYAGTLTKRHHSSAYENLADRTE